MQNDNSKAGHDHKGSSSANLPVGDSAGQLGARAAAKDARIKEAGLGGNRTGEVSATVKRAQAHRDAETESIPDSVASSNASPVAEEPETYSIQVQVNTDHNVHGSEKLVEYVQDTVNASLGRFGRQITRVEIHLSDDNGKKSHGDDKRCLLEARPAGHQPLVVTHVAATVDEALDGAVEMMEKLLDSTFHRLHDPKGRTSLGHNATL